MGDCYFAKEPPSIEMRGGLVFITPAGSQHEVAFTPHTLRKFIRSAERTLAEFDSTPKVVVLPRH